MQDSPEGLQHRPWSFFGTLSDPQKRSDLLRSCFVELFASGLVLLAVNGIAALQNIRMAHNLGASIWQASISLVIFLAGAALSLYGCAVQKARSDIVNNAQASPQTEKPSYSKFLIGLVILSEAFLFSESAIVLYNEHALHKMATVGIVIAAVTAILFFYGAALTCMERTCKEDAMHHTSVANQY